MDKKLTRGSRVIWDRAGQSGTITDGPFKDVPGYSSPCWVISLDGDTARLVAEKVLRLEHAPEWIPCFGEHRQSDAVDTVWEKLETAWRPKKLGDAFGQE